MNINAFFLTSFRIVLIPLALLYGMLVWVRNKLFDKKILKSATFGIPIINVGNIAVGGTGKSPMVLYLLHLLQPHFEVATLSRGYKRKTKGYVLANAESTAIEIGDEPMLFHQQFPDVAVAVGEERLVAIPQLLQDKPNTQVVVLDDAFQHRWVQAGLNILLTEYQNLYINDFFLPTGDLRDSKQSAKRADIIIVTKCLPTLSEAERRKITEQLQPQTHQTVYFTCLQYGTPYHITTKQERTITADDEVLVVCGIANPKPLQQYVQQHAHTYYFQSFKDHHIFSIDDVEQIQKKLAELEAPKKYILTTQKDAVRLEKFADVLQNIPMYVLPVQHEFMFGTANAFEQQISTFIKNYTTP
jgi:tetraacyldisaccharide 4'-kinase